MLFALHTCLQSFIRAHANGRNIVACWPTTHITVDPNMLRPFAWNHNNIGTCWHLLGIRYSLKPAKFLDSYKRTQHCWPTTRNNVGTCCVRLYGPLLACEPADLREKLGKIAGLQAN